MKYKYYRYRVISFNEYLDTQVDSSIKQTEEQKKEKIKVD